MASVILVFFFLLSAALPLSVHSSRGFSVDLIHRDSPKSPFYNPTLSHSDRLRAAARRSVARLAYFLNTASNDSFVSEVIPNSFEYLMTINIGTPPFKVMAVADTGSDLTWTQCKPCVQCYNQIAPIFDPQASSTYNTVSCKTRSCSALPQGGCGRGSTCEYRYSYGDRSYTTGNLSSETFTFNHDGGRHNKVSIPKILFGCSHESKGTFDKNGAGLVGLGGGPLSLVSQLGSAIDNKFSYCLVPYSDNSKSTSLLNFGGNANVGPHAVTTPIVSGETNTFYYLTLNEIRVGNEIVASAAPRKHSDVSANGKGNIIIDSGTTLTLLDSELLQPLIKKLSQIIKYPQVKDSDGLFDLCFDVSGVSSKGKGIDLPEVTFQFTGAAVRLSALNTFTAPKEGMLCLAMVSSQSQAGGVQIFGNIAQQNLHIGYDLKARKLSIAPADCAKL